MKVNNILKKIFISNILIMHIMCTIFSVFNNVYAYEISEYKDGINAFPESYKEALNNLKNAHPNWNFVAVYTNLSFDYVVEQEMVDGRSLISKSAFSDEWKRDNKEVEPGWVNASEKAVRYYLDPRNFLNEEKIFQFESTKFNEKAHTADVVEKVLAGTGLANANYYINAKNKVEIKNKFSDIIYLAGKENNVSAVHLASRIVQETGGTLGSIAKDGTVVLDASGNVGYYASNGTIRTANRAINGSYYSDTYGNFSGYYNFFNIGAYCTSSCGFCGNPFVHGLQRAKNSGWTTPNLAISAAAKYLNDNWIKYGQNTLYFEKFDVNFVEGAKYLFGNQYMTNISATSTESSLIYKGYKAANKLDSNFTFYIPVYDNMSSNSNNTSTTQKKVQVINCEGSYLNLRDGASMSSNIIGRVENGTIMTQILDDGSGFVKVRLSDGKEGYVSKQYISEVKNIEVTDIKLGKDKYTLSKDSKITITPTISPTNATDKSYTIVSDNEKILKVDGKSIIGVEIGKANVTFTTKNGKKVTVAVEVTKKEDKKYTIDTNKLTVSEDNYITGISAESKLSTITDSIKLNNGISIIAKNVKGDILNKDSLVGTDTVIRILDNQEAILNEYIIAIKGDTSGDGKINSADLLKLVQHLKGTYSINEISADVNNDGKINSADLLAIVQHLKGKKNINFK